MRTRSIAKLLSPRILSLSLLILVFAVTNTRSSDIAADSFDWGEPIDLGSNTWATESYDPVLVCDQYQNVHILWSGTRLGEPGMSIFYANDTVSGALNPADVLFDESQSMFKLQAVVVDQSDTLHLIWTTHRYIGNLYYSKVPLSEAADARAWSSPIALDNNVYNGAIATEPDGRIHIVYSKGDPDGLSFSLHHIVTGDGDTMEINESTIASFVLPEPGYVDVEMAIDENSRIHLGITKRSVEYASFSEVGYMRSPNAGETWDIYRLIDNVPSDWQGINWIAPYAFGTDEIHLTWHDPKRLDSISLDGGSSWSSPSEIFSTGAAFGGANGLVKDSAGNLHAVVAVFSGVYVVDGTTFGWGNATTIDDRSHDPHGQKMVSCQGNALHVAYWDRVGDQTVWYVNGRVDSPEIPRSPIPESASAVALANMQLSLPEPELNIVSQESDASLAINQLPITDPNNDSVSRQPSMDPGIWATSIGLISAASFIVLFIMIRLRRR